MLSAADSENEQNRGENGRSEASTNEESLGGEFGGTGLFGSSPRIHNLLKHELQRSREQHCPQVGSRAGE